MLTFVVSCRRCIISDDEIYCLLIGGTAEVQKTWFLLPYYTCVTMSTSVVIGQTVWEVGGTKIGERWDPTPLDGCDARLCRPVYQTNYDIKYFIKL